MIPCQLFPMARHLICAYIFCDRGSVCRCFRCSDIASLFRRRRSGSWPPSGRWKSSLRGRAEPICAILLRSRCVWHIVCLVRLDCVGRPRHLRLGESRALSHGVAKNQNRAQICVSSHAKARRCNMCLFHRTAQSRKACACSAIVESSLRTS